MTTLVQPNQHAAHAFYHILPTDPEDAHYNGCQTLSFGDGTCSPQTCDFFHLFQTMPAPETVIPQVHVKSSVNPLQQVGSYDEQLLPNHPEYPCLFNYLGDQQFQELLPVDEEDQKGASLPRIDIETPVVPNPGQIPLSGMLFTDPTEGCEMEEQAAATLVEGLHAENVYLSAENDIAIATRSELSLPSELPTTADKSGEELGDVTVTAAQSTAERESKNDWDGMTAEQLDVYVEQMMLALQQGDLSDLFLPDRSGAEGDVSLSLPLTAGDDPAFNIAFDWLNEAAPDGTPGVAAEEDPAIDLRPPSSDSSKSKPFKLAIFSGSVKSQSSDQNRKEKRRRINDPVAASIASQEGHPRLPKPRSPRPIAERLPLSPRKNPSTHQARDMFKRLSQKDYRHKKEFDELHRNTLVDPPEGRAEREHEPSRKHVSRHVEAYDDPLEDARFNARLRRNTPPPAFPARSHRLQQEKTDSHPTRRHRKEDERNIYNNGVPRMPTFSERQERRNDRRNRAMRISQGLDPIPLDPPSRESVESRAPKTRAKVKSHILRAERHIAKAKDRHGNGREWA